MKVKTNPEKKIMADIIITQPDFKVKQKPTKRSFVRGLIAGTLFGIAIGVIAIAAMYVGNAIRNTPTYKEYSATDVDQTVKETLIVTDTLEEYVLENGIRAVYDFERGLVTFIPPLTHKFSGSCLVSSFNTSDMMEPSVIMERNKGSEISLDVGAKREELRYTVSDIVLSEKALSKWTQDACVGRDIRMLQPTDRKVGHRQARKDGGKVVIIKNGDVIIIIIVK